MGLRLIKPLTRTFEMLCELIRYVRDLSIEAKVIASVAAMLLTRQSDCIELACHGVLSLPNALIAAAVLTSRTQSVAGCAVAIPPMRCSRDLACACLHVANVSRAKWV